MLFHVGTTTRLVSCRLGQRGSGSMIRSFMSTQALPNPAEDDAQMILILGKPGGGKGTISGKILQDFPKFHHVSTGDLLRQHVREETDLGKKAKEYMDSGSLVPDNLMIDLVMTDASKYMEEGKALLLDGFPRNIQQAEALEDVTHIDYVVNLDVPTETIVERIADRWIHRRRVVYTLTRTSHQSNLGWTMKLGSLLYNETMTNPNRCARDWRLTMRLPHHWWTSTRRKECSKLFPEPRVTCCISE